MDKKLNDDTFQVILDNAEDITETFEVNLGGLPEDVLQATQEATPFIETLRGAMTKKPLDPGSSLANIQYGLLDMDLWAKVHGDSVQKALAEGNVAAVDGTPLAPHRRFLTTQVFACAVGYLTALKPMEISATVTKTKAKAVHDGTLKGDGGVLNLIKQADLLTGSQSWPTAFMEYLEREQALECPADFVIVDGPLLTQNLLTRRQGRELFTKMLAQKHRKSYVGVIKDITRSGSEMRFFARALKTGELYIQGTLLNFLAERLERDYAGKTADFVKFLGGDILRGVFKPGQKAFGFECHRDDLPAVVSLLWLDRDRQMGHEIPFLLNQVDAQLRGRYRPAEVSALLDATITRQFQDEFFDEVEERDFR